MARSLFLSVATVFACLSFGVPRLEAQRGEQGRPGGVGPGGRGRGPAGPPQITQVAGDLYKVQTGPGVQPVTAFLVTQEGIILADPENANVTTFLKEEFARRFKVPVRYVIYSHYHWDHARGGSVFADTAKFRGSREDGPVAEGPLLGGAATRRHARSGR